MLGFEQIVDTVMELPFERQEMLKDLITKWHIEVRRSEIARDAEESLALYRTGQLKPQSAQNIIAELRRSLNDEP
jgi:hypothetical protein